MEENKNESIQVIPPAGIKTKERILASDVFESDIEVKKTLDSLDSITDDSIKLEVNSVEDKARAADIKKDIKDAGKLINDYRKNITDEFNNKIINPLIAQAKIYNTILDKAEKVIEGKVRVFIIAQRAEQKKAEEKERLRLEKEATAREEAEKKIEDAKKKVFEASTPEEEEEAANSVEEAEKATDKAKLKAPINIPIVETKVKTEKGTMSEKDKWGIEVLDKKELIRYAIEEGLWDLINVNMKELKPLAKVYKDNKKIPGCRVYCEIGFSNR